ncbi:MAG TPA: phosphodiester glycosidase family protein [Patescibacteria group bacterium]|nr:phosphodiester glycosidase family protein [Patescibacteria group bacterium]
MKFLPNNFKKIAPIAAAVVLIGLSVAGAVFVKLVADKKVAKTNKRLVETSAELDVFKSRDEYLINQSLEASISAVKTTFDATVKAYETYLDLTDSGIDTKKLAPNLAKILSYLADVNYASASAEIKLFNASLADLKPKAGSLAVPDTANLPQSNTPPGAGYSRQVVSTAIGPYTVSLVAADLNSAKVIIDTASDGDCRDNCPVLSLADYVGRSGAFAGVNGSYFCPASYPSCVGKTNSFDTLLMNKNKVYFNSDNNVYSTVPAVIFSGNSARFVGQSLEWGRDTGVDAVIANYPLLLSGGSITFTGGDDPKQGSKGGRSFVGVNGSTVYIGVVHNATVAEAAYALKALGLTHALNLDDGGSTALYSGGYKAGPGRNLPNAVLLVNR